jgi:TatD DNase family protein
MALGCHLLRAEQVTGSEKALFLQLVNETDYIGEIGLDASRHGKATLAVQRRVLDFVLHIPEVQHKVLTVHSRGAEQETIERLATAKVNAILHWYTGALKYIPAALDAGLWFSIHPAMLRSRKGQQIIAAIPKERIVTETDGPFATIAGRPCSPADIPSFVGELARMWGEDPAETQARIFKRDGAPRTGFRRQSVSDQPGRQGRLTLRPSASRASPRFGRGLSDITRLRGRLAAPTRAS